MSFYTTYPKYNSEANYQNSFAVKCNIAVQGANIHCGAKILQDYISPYDADVISTLIYNGFFPTLIVDCDEFAIGGMGYNAWRGNGINPFDETQIVGGSSFGSALAVANNLVPFSLGSSTGGSIRTPAHFTKLFGFEPSQGAVSRFGLTLHSSSMDKIGIISRDIPTIHKIFCLISQPSYKDLQNWNFIYRTKPIKKIGIYLKAESEYKSEYLNFVQNLKDVEIIDISAHLDFLNDIYLDYYYISAIEVVFNLGRFNGSRFLKNYRQQELEGCNWEEKYQIIYQDLGENTRRRLALGHKILQNEELLHTIRQKIQTFRQTMEYIYSNLVDCIALPTCPFQQFFKSDDQDIDRGNLLDKYTAFVNLFGGCAINIPLDTPHNIFQSVQFIANNGNDFGLIDFLIKQYE